MLVIMLCTRLLDCMCACLATVFFLCMVAVAYAAPPLPLREGSPVYVEQEPYMFPDIRMFDATGQKTTLSQSNGKVRLINFWATWCAPCVHELPVLQALQERYPDTLQVIALNEDKDGFDTITPFVEKHGLQKLTHYWDRYGVEFGKLRMQGLPMSFLIDTEGRLIATIQGETDWLGDDMAGLYRRVMNTH
jgi:thiol-disulfide isomerase/thioredoxin